MQETINPVFRERLATKGGNVYSSASGLIFPSKRSSYLFLYWLAVFVLRTLLFFDMIGLFLLQIISERT
jgi:hypothetical protein